MEARVAGTDGKPPLVPPELHGQIPEAGKRAASRRMQLRYNIVRMYRRYWRLPAYNFTRLATMLFLACLLGLALLQIVSFSNDGNTQEAATLIPGAAFLALLPAVLSTNNAVSPSIVTRAAFYRELAAGEYGVWAFYVAQGAAELPYAVLQTIFFLVPYNALVGLPWSAFPFFLLAAVLFYTFATLAGQAIAAMSPTEEIALTIAPLFNTLLNLLSGFLIKREDIPSYWYVSLLCVAHLFCFFWQCRTSPGGPPIPPPVLFFPRPRVLPAASPDCCLMPTSLPTRPALASVLSVRLPLYLQDLALLCQSLRLLQCRRAAQPPAGHDFHVHQRGAGGVPPPARVLVVLGHPRQ